MAKIWDIDVYSLSQVENNSSKVINNSLIIDGLSNINQQGQDSPQLIIAGAIYSISPPQSEVQKKQVFGLCTNYYKNRFLIYLQADNFSGWYKALNFTVEQLSGPCYFPFNLSVVRLSGQPALYWSSLMIYNDYLSNYQYFISLSSGQNYTGGKYQTVDTETGVVSTSIENLSEGQFIPPLLMDPIQAGFYNGQCLALNRFRIGDNNLYRTFEPYDNVEQINNGIVGVSWGNGQLKILVWDTVWIEVAIFNLLITEIARQSFSLYLPYVISNVSSPPTPPTGPPTETGGGVITPIDEGLLAFITKPFLIGVNINQVEIKLNGIIKNDSFVKSLNARLVIRKGLPIIWIEFRTSEIYGIHHNSNLEIIGGQEIASIENENESGLSVNGLASVSRWGKAVLDSGVEVGFIWTRKKQDYLSNPAYPRPGDDTHLTLSRLTGDNSISCLGIFALKSGHTYDTDQLAELFYGNSSTLHTII